MAVLTIKIKQEQNETLKINRLKFFTYSMIISAFMAMCFLAIWFMFVNKYTYYHCDLEVENCASAIKKFTEYM